MKLRLIVVAVTAALVPAALSAAAIARSSSALVNLRHTRIGAILVNSSGYTLYAFGPDRRNQDVCVRIPQCLNLWPAVTTRARPRAGKGVNSRLLGTIKLGRSLQVTYAGHPLYTYKYDTRPGQISNVNINQFGGPWPAVNAAGGFVK